MDINTQNTTIVPFYTEPDRYLTYSKFDPGLIEYSRVLICYAEKPESIDYCSVHLLIPAKFPRIALNRLNKEWPEFVSISNPLIAFLLNIREHSSSSVAFKLLKLNVDSWEDVLPYLEGTSPHFKSTMEVSTLPKLSNRSRKHLRFSDKAIFKILEGKEIDIPGKEIIIPHIRTLKNMTLLRSKRHQNTSKLDHKPFSGLKIEDIYGD
jgi:hypothetical protein